MAKEGQVYENKWKPGTFYRDMVSHFLRMDDKAVSAFFNERNGVFANCPNTPNWVEFTEDGYELVRMDGSEVASRTGLFLNLTPNPALETIVDIQDGKGKTVAHWNYHCNLPNLNNERDTIKISTEDALKSIVCYKDGFMYSFPCRMQRANNAYTQHSQLQLHSVDGDFPHTPFVNIAFFLWIEETEDGKTVAKWLHEKMGWSIAST